MGKGLTKTEQAWLLGHASFCLMSLGRLGEAVVLREAHLKLSENLKGWNWKEPCISAQNLIVLYLPLGQLAQAVPVAHQAIQYAEQSGDLVEQIKSHAYFATTLHRQGLLDLAHQSFQHAEQLQQERQPEHPQLYSLPGFLYCALLLDQAQSVAEFEAVLGRGETILEVHKIHHPRPSQLDFALSYLTLARSFSRLQRNTDAATAFDQAVADIRKAGKIEFTPIFLIDRANFHLRLSRLNLEAAAHDLQEADSLIRRCGMKLYDVDCQLAWCRFYLKRAEKEKARTCWQKAKDLIAITGYHLRDKDLQALKTG